MIRGLGVALLVLLAAAAAHGVQDAPDGAVLGWQPQSAQDLPQDISLAFLDGSTVLLGGRDGLDLLGLVESLEQVEGQWRRRTRGRLPRPLLHPATASATGALFVVGGEDLAGARAEVFALLDPRAIDARTAEEGTAEEPGARAGPASPGQQGELLAVGHWPGASGRRWPIPDLPRARSMAACAIVDSRLLVLGGAQDSEILDDAWELALDEAGPDWNWRAIPSPGARAGARLAVQHGGDVQHAFLLGGTGPDRRARRDCWRLDRSPGGSVRWTPIRALPLDLARPTAQPLGGHHLLVVGDTPKDGPRSLLYHTVTDTWLDLGPLPWKSTLGLVQDADGLLALGRIEGGQAGVDRADVNTPNAGDSPAEQTRAFRGVPAERPGSFARLDVVVVLLYLGALVVLGWWFSRKEDSTERFFLGSRRIPWWAAGLSIFGTQLSAITFMAIPAVAYRTDWVYFLGNVTIVLAAPIVVFCYLPHLRSEARTSAYEMLERRFGLAVRLVGGAAFLLFQLGRMGIVLYLPALALATVTGTDVFLCILLMGCLATVYTVLGGIEAVIWTDVLQVFVLLGGALLCIGVVLSEVDGGFPEVFEEARQHGKFRMVTPGASFATTALWVVVLGRFFDSLTSYTSDQAVVQRYLTTADPRRAARSVWTNAVLTIPASMIFFGLGSALWVFYRHHPERLHPSIGNDDVLPFFISHELPAGLAGLVIAGLFAAAMSSLDSSMNSMATVVTTDGVKRLRATTDDARCLRLARGLTILFGALGTGSALVMAALQSRSMLDQYAKIVGLFGGGLAGLFATAVFLPRRSSAAALAGFFGSALVLYWVQSSTQMHFFLYAGVGVVSCMLLSLIAGWLLPLRGEPSTPTVQELD